MSSADVQDLMLTLNRSAIEQAMDAEMYLHRDTLRVDPSYPVRPTPLIAPGNEVITDRGPVRADVPRDEDCGLGRTLQAMYPVVFFDALRNKIRDGGVINNHVVNLALGIEADEQRCVLEKTVAFLSSRKVRHASHRPTSSPFRRAFTVAIRACHRIITRIARLIGRPGLGYVCKHALIYHHIDACLR